MDNNEKINPTQRDVKNKVVKTYAEDMAKVIEDGTGGMIKQIIAGEEENEKERQNFSPQSRKNKLFISFGVVFIFLALAVLSFFLFRGDAPAIPVEQQFVPIIFTDKTNFVEVAGLKKDTVAENLQSLVNNTGVKAGGVEGIYLAENKNVVGLRRFIQLIEGNLTFGDVFGDTHFVEDHFLMGVVNNEAKSEDGADKDFFILLKVRSVADIFENMRTWESKMFLDLHGFFGIELTPENIYLLTENFQDGIIENKNARILYYEESEEGAQIALMYIFADDTSVIITNTENAAEEIMLRLAQSQIKN